MSRRVVITGMGALTPVGLDVKTSWENLRSGVLGFGPITHFDASEYKAKLAAELKGFDSEKFIEKKDARRMDRFTQYAVSAAVMCLEDSGLDLDAVNKNRFGVILGTGVGGLETMGNEQTRLNERGPGRVSPMLVPMLIGNIAAGQIALRFGLQGPCDDSCTACASGTTSIGNAFRHIKHGYADRMLAGGAESAITPLGVSGFTNLTALSTASDPVRASIPFDKERHGFVIGEGAGLLLLEEYEAAKARGAHIYAEVLGYGFNCDAYHLTAPRPGGEGIAQAMRLAMEEGGVQPEQVGYVNAHGTSTPANDLVETQGIKLALGAHAYKTAVSSIKSMIGHSLGAAGAIEAIVCALALQDSFLPPTMGLQIPDPECDLDYLPNQGRAVDLQYCLSNSMGFGGHNGVLLLGKA